MARSITGPRMQARLLDALEGGNVRTMEDLERALRVSHRELLALAEETRRVRREAGGPAPVNVWGVGFRLEARS